jgi:hypothetical protein
MPNFIATGIQVTFTGLTAELVDVDHSGETTDTQEVTHQQSASNHKEFKASLTDPGEVTLALNFDQAARPANGASGTLQITWPTGAGTFSCSAILTKGRQISAKLGQKITEAITFKLTGVPTWTPPTAG